MSRRSRHAAKLSTPAHERQLPVPAERDTGLFLVTFVACVCLTLLSYARDLGGGFSNDDFLFLKKVRWTDFRDLFSPETALVGWFRPWSRELHFWLLNRLFGESSVAFHGVNLLLWCVTVALVFGVLRRLAGARVAAVATLGSVATAAWGLYPVWACCSQDLWMLVFGLLFLDAFLARRTALAVAALALALLSKETAVLLVPVAAWLDRRQAPASRTGRQAWVTMLAVVVGWAVVHPSLGGRFLFGQASKFDPTPATPASLSNLRWFLAVVNLEYLPLPQGGWRSIVLETLAWVGITGGATAWALRGGKPSASARESRALVLDGLGWWGIVWLPMAAPFLHWHTYYGWLGICGAWLAIAAGLQSRPRWVVLLVALVAALRPGEARTLREEWATEEYQRVAASRLRVMRESLKAQHPSLPSHARVFLAGLPGGTGFRSGPHYSAAMHVWYGDTTIVGTVFSDYVPRSPDAPQGPDYFFVAEENLFLLPVANGAAPAPDSLRRSERWRIAEEQVAGMFTDGGEWAKAILCFARLGQTWPDTARHAFNLGVAYARSGRTDEAGRWLNRADSLVGSPPRDGRGYLSALPQ